MTVLALTDNLACKVVKCTDKLFNYKCTATSAELHNFASLRIWYEHNLDTA